MNDKPHILILMTDQQRADCLSCVGHPQLLTPNMDRIAAEGMNFTEAVTVCPVCMPARASFVNSLYPHNHDMWGNRGQMPAEDETFFQLLQENNYLTAHIGKSHYYEHKHGTHMRDYEDYMHARGLEYVHETTGPHATCNTRSYMTDDWKKKDLYEKFIQDYKIRGEARNLITDPSPLPVEDFLDSYIGGKTVEFVENYQDSRPMCLFVGFGGPHEPWDAPGEYATMYDPEKTPGPLPAPEFSEDLPGYAREKVDFTTVDGLTPDIIGKIRANYYGKISLIDNWIGQIFNAFKKRGWLEDLFIVFWSDHGEMAGDHGRLYKHTFHEASVRVPLMLRWPGHIPAGKTSDSLVEIIDLFPTIIEATGSRPSERALGKSLWPVIKGEVAELREWQLSEIGEHNVMIRNHQYKYVVDGEFRGFMLYDLQNDPDEQNNLIGSPGVENLELRLNSVLREMFEM